MSLADFAPTLVPAPALAPRPNLVTPPLVAVLVHRLLLFVAAAAATVAVAVCLQTRSTAGCVFLSAGVGCWLLIAKLALPHVCHISQSSSGNDVLQLLMCFVNLTTARSWQWLASVAYCYMP